jgi:hypothetical protein
MKHILSLIIVILAFASFMSAQPKTVTDYYLAMPNNVYSTDMEGNKITSKPTLTKFRKSLIKIEDIKNGYLKLEGTWEGWAEIALFKKTDGQYIIAQAENGCGPACVGFVKFWTYTAGKWTEITKQVFADLSEKTAAKAFNAKKPAADEAADEKGFSFYYLLPRQGKTLKVACNECTQSGAEDFVFMEYEWNGAKFVKK